MNVNRTIDPSEMHFGCSMTGTIVTVAGIHYDRIPMGGFTVVGKVADDSTVTSELLSSAFSPLNPITVIHRNLRMHRTMDRSPW